MSVEVISTAESIALPKLWHAVNSHELDEVFATSTAMLMDVLASGPFEPHPWRVQVGLPDAPETSR